MKKKNYKVDLIQFTFHSWCSSMGLKLGTERDMHLENICGFPFCFSSFLGYTASWIIWMLKIHFRNMRGLETHSQTMFGWLFSVLHCSSSWLLVPVLILKLYTKVSYSFQTESRRFAPFQTRASSSEESPVDANEIFTDLKEKVRNKLGTLLP